MLATIVDVFSQFIALCFKHVKELILLNTLYISDSNAKLYTYLQFQLSPRKKLIVMALSDYNVLAKTYEELMQNVCIR